MIIILTFSMKGSPEVYLPKVLPTRLVSYQKSVFFFAPVFKQFKIFFLRKQGGRKGKLFLLQVVSVEIHLYFFSEETLCK